MTAVPQVSTGTEHLPCPFCGSANLKSGGDDKVVAVWCLGCEATGPNHYGKTEWNTRALAHAATPQTLPGMIAAVYGDLDAEDCKWIDGQWAKQRGYILPTDGTSTLAQQPVGCGDPSCKDTHCTYGQDEPVAWRLRHKGSSHWEYRDEQPNGPSVHLFDVQPLYAAPQPASNAGGDSAGARLSNWLADYSHDLMEDGDLDQEAAEIKRAAQWIADRISGAAYTWQDIETAPRDGTRILATGGGIGPTVEIVSYNERVGAWDAPNDTLDDRDDEPQGYSRPALWQPLPTPSLPSTQEKSPVMQAAEKAAAVMEGWSDAKRKYADRVTSADGGTNPRPDWCATEDSICHHPACACVCFDDAALPSTNETGGA